MTKSPYFLLRTLAFVLAFALLLSCAGCKSSGKEDRPPEPVKPKPTEEPAEPAEGGGYLSAAPFGAGFIACGTGGRVDAISMDGTVTALKSGTTETLRGVFTEGSNALVCGDNGTLLMSNDAGESFQQLNVKAAGDLNAAVVYQNAMYAAGDGGVIYRQKSGGWEAMQMESTNEIISLIATNYCIAAITAETDVYVSTDGLEWEYMNFNEDYDGLYPRYVFTKAVGAGETFFILGYHEENRNLPLIMFTELGEVYLQKELMKVNDEPLSGKEDMYIHDISFNVDQIVGVLNGGRVLAITDCAVCNEEMKLDDTDSALWATAVQPEGVLVCGEDFYARILSSKQIRQDKIKAEQAMADMDRGAILIDVREDDELAADGYILGSVHIPLAEVEQRLPEVVPDQNTELIFYCASGKRSQKATELAVDMGYYSVYNLGGLSDWPYEIVKD